MKVAIVGAGWAGCTAAIEATRLGHQVTLFEASRSAGGRARRVDVLHEGQALSLDNGQHILIGAYTQTLKLMAELGVDASAALLRLPLTLESPDGSGIRLAKLPAPINALLGISLARGWRWGDKVSLLKTCLRWRHDRFDCPPEKTVAALCEDLSPRVMASLIEPLCVSALNTPPARASGQVFLRVLQDALFSGRGASDFLLPRVDLSALMPAPALSWLTDRSASVRLATRVQGLRPCGTGWALATSASDPEEIFDRAILACPAGQAAQLLQASVLPDQDLQTWVQLASNLQYEAITTVYAMASGARLRQPMLALAASAAQPAQFVFDRGQLGGPPGLLAFVISASSGDRASLTADVLAQARQQLGLLQLQAVQTVVEKRATFACTPGLQRPGLHVAPGLLACGDYVAGPYPATLEGAVRSGLQAASNLINL